jgi:ribosomal protein L11 methylase PrmA
MLRIAPRFDCIVMNMISAESEPLLSDVFSLLTPSGYLIWSGLLIDEKNTIQQHASEKGFSLFDESFEEEWWCGVFHKNNYEFKVAYAF